MPDSEDAFGQGLPERRRGVPVDAAAGAGGGVEELPLPVERLPVGPRHLRPRVVGQRVGGAHLRSPRCGERRCLRHDVGMRGGQGRAHDDRAQQREDQGDEAAHRTPRTECARKPRTGLAGTAQNSGRGGERGGHAEPGALRRARRIEHNTGHGQTEQLRNHQTINMRVVGFSPRVGGSSGCALEGGIALWGDRVSRVAGVGRWPESAGLPGGGIGPGC
jgi:hypothetical protein